MKIYVLSESYNIGAQSTIFKTKDKAKVALIEAFERASEELDHQVEAYCNTSLGTVRCESGDFWHGVIEEKEVEDE